MILDNRRITIREVADDVGISFGSCQPIFTDVLSIKRVSGKIVPKLLYFEQTQRCMDFVLKILTANLMDRLIIKNTCIPVHT